MTFRLSYEHSVKVVYLQGCLRNIAQENVDSNGLNFCAKSLGQHAKVFIWTGSE